MSFSYDDLKKTAKLARLLLNDETAKRLGEDVEKIVSFVDQLKEVDVEGVAPMAHAGDNCLLLREDRSGAVVGRECLSKSEGFEEGLIRVPKIIE